MRSTIHIALVLAAILHANAHRGEAEEATTSLLELGSKAASGTQVTSSMLLADCNTEHLASESSQKETLAWMQHCVDTLHSYYQQAKQMEWSSRDANQRYASDIELVKSVLRRLQSRAGVHSEYFEAFRTDEKNVVHQLLHPLDKDEAPPAAAVPAPAAPDVAMVETTGSEADDMSEAPDFKHKLAKHHHGSSAGASLARHKHHSGRISSAPQRSLPDRVHTSSGMRHSDIAPHMAHHSGPTSARRLPELSSPKETKPLVVRPSPVTANIPELVPVDEIESGDGDSGALVQDSEKAEVSDNSEDLDVAPSAATNDELDDRKRDALSSFLRQSIFEGLHEVEAGTLTEQPGAADDEDVFRVLSPNAAMDQAMDQVRAAFPDVVLSEPAA
mmetsp:Transcript_41793/g.75872  ORF Transcript_41793/g.75872 Transcript_41793/m.75872 type:complete len:388 (+) Transcript_41793:110-1273(+)